MVLVCVATLIDRRRASRVITCFIEVKVHSSKLLNEAADAWAGRELHCCSRDGPTANKACGCGSRGHIFQLQ